ncbi:GYF domain-containing protein [Paludisphaera borealis]|uniref:GYF domain-containing protein n=1 Tax=Paludisphaera borealis TaxID=1387353 RepID=A0A1U7CMG0_9BACT|nr:GYF domain-containing protein [Paludisphaera borealis]APW60107.1 hypothetical protein BSF38_01571 [Paludisphaera borealis]
MAEQSWFIRSRGRVFGPFTLTQFEVMSKRGQFTRFHEVSTDRQNWGGAAAITDRFSASHGQPAATAHHNAPIELVETEPGLASAADAPGWYFARGERQEGPVPFHELQRMANQGEITPRTLVWKNGMPEWASANQVGGLVFPGGSNSGSPAPFSQAAGDYPTPFTTPRTSGLAIASLVLGILWLCGLGSLLSTIFGSVALSQISRSRGTLEGKGMAIAGLVLGLVGLSWLLLVFLGILVGPPRPRF